MVMEMVAVCGVCVCELEAQSKPIESYKITKLTCHIKLTKFVFLQNEKL